MTAGWRTGPTDDGARYVVDDLDAGSRVFRARRVAGTGTADLDVVLKQIGAVDSAREQLERRRAVALGAIDHANLTRYLDVFRGPALHRDVPPPPDEWDVLYAVFPWHDGRTLWAVRDDPGARPESGRVVRDLAGALDAVHGAGWVHGDVHPGNVVIGPDGRAVLIDMDAALEIGAARPDRPTGVVGFVPPELDDDPTARPASDGWQLAMIAVQLLAGHPIGRDGSIDQLGDELGEHLGARRARAVVRVLAPMLDRDPGARPNDLGAWADDLASAVVDGRGRATRRVLAVAAAAAVIGVIAAVTLPGDDAADAEASPAPQPVEVSTACGVIDGSAALSSGHAELWDESEVRILRALDGDCGERVDTFVNAVVIETGDHVIVVSPEDHVVRLPRLQWASYQEMAGRRRPETAADLGGYPVSTEVDDDGVALVELSSGGVLVATSLDDPPYWIPRQLRGRWEDRGGRSSDLGFPASHPFLYEDMLVQDFEHGEVSAPAESIYQPDEEIDLVVTIPDQPGEPLEEFLPVEDRILRQRSGIAWYIDDDGTRHWIPDGGTWECLGGEAIAVPHDLPASAIGTLPEGDHATCES